MTQLTVDGTFYHRGIAGDPIVIVSALDEGAVYSWREREGVFTQIVEHRDPDTAIDRAAIDFTEGAATGLHDGTPVRLTIDVRPEKRGLGIAIVSGVPR